VDRNKNVKYQKLKVIKKKGTKEEQLTRGKLLHFVDNQFSKLESFLKENWRLLVELPLDFLLSKSLIEPLNLKRLNFLATEPVSRFTKKHAFQLRNLSKNYAENGLEISIYASVFEKFKYQLAPIKFDFFCCRLEEQSYNPACFYGVDSPEIFEKVKDKGELFCGKLFGDFQKVGEITALSYLQTTLARALEILEREDVKIEELENLIKTDPQLALNVIRYANSPLIAPPTPIKDLKHAIVYLGLARLQQFLITLMMSQLASVDADFENLALRIAAYGFLMEKKGSELKKYSQCQLFLAGIILGAQKIFNKPLSQIIEMLSPPQHCQPPLEDTKIKELYSQIGESEVEKTVLELKKLLGSAGGA